MLSKLSIVIDDKQWALMQVDRNQPGVGAFIDIDDTTGAVDVGDIQRSLPGAVDKTQVCLGIPHRDLIIRAFVLPEMTPTELTKAINFEIKKYIPFNIAEAFYSTITFPFVENNNKMMRVLFYAVRKSTIEKYNSLLTQAGLTVTRCEPAICGLVRAMIFRKDIHPADKLALLDIRAQKGIIYFIDAGVVKFVREISLTVAVDPMNQESSDPEALKARFLNEIHNSFDFYYRQFGERVTELLVVGSDDWFVSVSSFMTSVNIKCRKHSFAFVSGVRMITEFAMCCAFGLGLTGNMFVPPVDFLIPQKVSKKNVFEGLSFDAKELVPALRLAVGIVVLLVGVAVFLWSQEDVLKKQLAQAIAGQNEFASVTVDDLQVRISKAQENMKGLGQVPLKSNQHLILLLIAQHMPAEMWLQDVSLSYNDRQDTVSISLRAVVFKADVSQQARVINAFLADLKNDKALAHYVPKWQLKTMNRQQNKNVMTTVFDLSNG